MIFKFLVKINDFVFNLIAVIFAPSSYDPILYRLKVVALLRFAIAIIYSVYQKTLLLDKIDFSRTESVASMR